MEKRYVGRDCLSARCGHLKCLNWNGGAILCVGLLRWAKGSFAERARKPAGQKRLEGIIWLALVKSYLHSTKFKPAYLHTGRRLPCTIHEDSAVYDTAMNEKSCWRAISPPQKMICHKVVWTNTVQKLLHNAKGWKHLIEEAKNYIALKQPWLLESLVRLDCQRKYITWCLCVNE
jgi:hypothetical protein